MFIIKNTKKIVFISLLVSLGLALGIIESLIPFPFIVPGVKLGLANIIALTTLIIFGFKEALMVSIFRSVLLALATGNLAGLPYSLTGAIFSVVVMTMVEKYLSNYFSLIGVSILGAVAHNFAQISVASLILENIKIFSYLPVMTLMSLLTGYIVGLSSIFISKNLRNAIKVM